MNRYLPGEIKEKSLYCTNPTRLSRRLWFVCFPSSPRRARRGFFYGLSFCAGSRKISFAELGMQLHMLVQTFLLTAQRADARRSPWQCAHRAGLLFEAQAALNGGI